MLMRPPHGLAQSQSQPVLQPRLEPARNLNTQDIPGAQPRKTLKIRGLKRSNFFPEMPQIEAMLTKDKMQRNSSVLSFSEYSRPALPQIPQNPSQQPGRPPLPRQAHLVKNQTSIDNQLHHGSACVPYSTTAHQIGRMNRNDLIQNPALYQPKPKYFYNPNV